MKRDTLAELLLKNESSTLDFKQEAYWDGTGVLKAKEADLLKDFLAMANNPRGERGYLVLGVKARMGQPCSFHSVPLIDDATISQFINSKLDVHVHWTLTFRTEHNAQLAVIEIHPPPHGPVTLKKDFPDGNGKPLIRRERIFSRRQSTNVDMAPAEYVQLLRVAPANAASSQLPAEGTVERWFEILSAHNVDRACALRFFPHFSLADMTSYEAASKVLRGEEIEKTCSVFRINRQWLESGWGSAQQTIDIWSLPEYLAEENARSHCVSLTWYSDAEQPEIGRLWHACPIVDSHVPELDDVEIFRYAPMSRIFWSNEVGRLRLFFDVLWIAAQLEVPMYWYTVKKVDALSLIANGEKMTATLLKGIEAKRQGFHPEDLVERRDEWKVEAVHKDVVVRIKEIKQRTNGAKTGRKD